MKRNRMKKLKNKVPSLALIVSMLLSLLLMTTGTVYAGGSTPLPTEVGPQVTNFTVSPAGNITTGTQITLTLDILDDRITSGTDITATGTVNTPSFTGANATTGKNGTDTTPITPTVGGATYKLTFTLNYTGTGNKFSCYISYTGTGPIPIASIDSVTINNCVEFVAPAPAEPAPPATPVPTNFILRDANYGSDTIYAGEAFTLSVVILATSGSSAVNNVSVSFTPPEEMTFVDGSSVVYKGTMSPGATSTVSVNLMPNGNIPEGSYPVNINVNGFDSKGGNVSAPMTVTVPVLQPERFEIFNSMLPTYLTAGMDDGSGYGSVTLVNKGQGPVANVTVEVVGEGLSLGDGRQFMGNISGGTEKTADLMISASTPGMISAMVVVTYENVRGEQKSLELPFDIEVVDFMPPDMDDSGIMFPEEQPVSTGFQGWILIVIIAAAAVAGTILLVHRHKKKKAAAEAALDDLADEDDD